MQSDQGLERLCSAWRGQLNSLGMVEGAREYPAMSVSCGIRVLNRLSQSSTVS